MTFNKDWLFSFK